MPKRVGHLYERMCDKELIRAAIKKGSKGKKKRRDVQRVLKDPEKYVDKVYELLVTDTYIPTPPKTKRIFDKSSGKEREINIVPFYPDGIMHQLCVMAMHDVLMRGMYRWSCASIPGRGNACARKYVRRALDKSASKNKILRKNGHSTLLSKYFNTEINESTGKENQGQTFSFVHQADFRVESE